MKVFYPYAYSGAHSSWMVVVVKTEENEIETLFYSHTIASKDRIRPGRKYDILFENGDIDGLIGNSPGTLENVKKIKQITSAD